MQVGKDVFRGHSRGYPMVRVVKSVEPPSESLQRFRVHGAVTLNNSCLLDLGDQGILSLRSKPDQGLARRWSASVRSVTSIKVQVADGYSRAVVSGQGSRGVPFSRRVPTAVALGLIELGFPCVVLCNPATAEC